MANAYARHTIRLWEGRMLRGVHAGLVWVPAVKHFGLFMQWFRGTEWVGRCHAAVLPKVTGQCARHRHW